MWESIALIIAAILAAFAVCMSFFLSYRSDVLDDKEEELSKFSVHLDERANRIAADEATLSNEWLLLKEAKKELDYHAKRTTRSTDNPGH